MHNCFLVDTYIGLGSNLANPRQQIITALEEIAALPDCDLYNFSSLYQSKPMGPANQPPYINAVAQIQTRLSADILLHYLQAIENAHQRQRNGERWGPRTLDLDILVYGNYSISHKDLTVPHPGIKYREFVLYPLHEINKNLMIPSLGVVHRIKQHCQSNGLVQLYI